MKKNQLSMFLLLVLIPLFTGCAHVFHVAVDSINDGQPVAHKNYVIVPGNSDTDASDLQFREYASYLGRALQKIGYTPASENQKSDVQIYLSYGIGEPQQRTRTYTVPVMGQTGEEVTTNETTVTTKHGTDTQSSTDVTPQYGVTGYTTESENYTTYPKYVQIDAYDAANIKPGDKMTEVWKTTIHSEGKRNELRQIFPILIAAASKYLGGNTGREVNVDLTGDSEEVRIVKGIQE